VGVEKLDLSKTVKKTLRLDALQTMISVLVDIFYPPKFGCFEENGLFQHPQALALIDPPLPQVSLPIMHDHTAYAAVKSIGAPLVITSVCS